MKLYISWQKGEWLQVSNLDSLSTWPGEEAGVELLASITSKAVLRSKDYLAPPLP